MKKTLELITLRDGKKNIDAIVNGELTVGELRDQYEIAGQLAVEERIGKRIILSDETCVKKLPSEKLYEAVGVIGGYK